VSQLRLHGATGSKTTTRQPNTCKYQLRQELGGLCLVEAFTISEEVNPFNTGQKAEAQAVLVSEA